MYNTYPSDYTTYERVNEQLKSNPSEGDLTNDQAIIEQYISVASDQVRHFCSRTFVPYIYDDVEVLYGQLSRYWVLSLPDDAQLVSQVTGDDEAVIPSDQYRLRDYLNQLNAYPKRYVEFSRLSNIYINSGTYEFAPSFTINGIWGYSSRPYEDSWQTTTTLTASINASVTSVTVTSSNDFEILDYIRIEDEFMQITANDAGTDTITVIRGVNGSTAAAHDGTVTPLDVDMWRIEDAVRDATTRLTAYLYTSRQATGNTIVFQDGTVASQYPALVWSSLLSYKRVLFESV